MTKPSRSATRILWTRRHVSIFLIFSSDSTKHAEGSDCSFRSFLVLFCFVVCRYAIFNWDAWLFGLGLKAGAGAFRQSQCATLRGKGLKKN